MPDDLGPPDDHCLRDHGLYKVDEPTFLSDVSRNTKGKELLQDFGLWVAEQGNKGQNNSTMAEHELQLSRLFEMLVWPSRRQA